MKWFKHISDSLDDPFIFDLCSEFGSSGYYIFFGVLEIYSREFKTEKRWKLILSWDYVCTKLGKTRPYMIKKVFLHCHNSGKWDVEFNEKKVTIFIHKFREYLDETTIRKLREKEKRCLPKTGLIPELNRIDTGALPKKRRTEEEEEVDVDKRTKTVQPDGCNNHLKNKVGTFFKSINESCLTLNKFPKKDGRPFNPYQWVQEKCNKKCHPGAIEETIRSISTLKAWSGITGHPYAYLNAILKTKNQNWNEKEAVKFHDEMKQWRPSELSNLTAGIMKDIQ